ncbi:MAG: DUF523 domain-containing protein [Acidobacteria bacterium]|nr:DUF523 domain-containing protein [Acidobacteriota bacterium]
MIKVLVSACLLGEAVRYHGGAAASEHPVLAAWRAEGRLISFCPEVAGGLGVPRPPAEIRGEGGASVLSGTGRVVTAGGVDVTDAFLRGARLALDAALAEGVGVAVLKDGSPSCGAGFTYDGSFTGRRRAGPGVTAALLEREGIRVFTELEIERAAECVRELERSEARDA